MLEDLYIEQPNQQIREEVLKNWQSVLLPDEDMGILADLTADYLMMTDGRGIRGVKPVMLLMCGDHGICKYGVSAFPQEVTLQMINGYGRGTAGANVMARHAGADIIVVDVGTNFDLQAFPHVRQCKIAWGTEDFTQGPAMTKEQAIAALETGMRIADEAIDHGCNLLETGEMGIANTTSTAAIAAGFLDLPAELTTGRGSGINDERMKIKTEVVRRGLEVNKPKPGDGMDVLCKVGGYDHAGLAGMILAGAARHVPTMVDGVNATAAALIAYGISPNCAKYMLCSHLSSDVSAKKMLEVLGLKPIVHAGMRLGEGTGASLAISILRSALDTYRKLTGE
ncbi:MAG: nicotinate-nucleotide--dimethylbenzimidazole phosphoribosyltransferase [Succiniclasticum sp.]|uniref:nicotinate-nucleotide--dimethylbenzimidazole phosphoribosyltransferase n=1 Tax=Succiniclasticum sp. TaxID=2775030 RepID=UPI000E88131C|nr:nicotinate-nucleotide--dimethylbenzimidazole phosphoribosyltransferase [Succiniclasticum sp.]MBO5637823.1 nicotinate-nucleotide--dimethylbenzimidazole phosphoribosyltransferase [Acidaminococcaceae bacterium]MBR1493832.1 nicotinate-nucleotide--dimethylbenzimidazole phosphoribosyltransferase [Acidaminococcaceae bacterium]MBR1661352.1 nicotinate-nucleotide--dimethylbenzimidazole phosphoribosyltransferase [Acidaminococcaceae bacterium]MDY6291756.1 nicotinate-nucleotide--dimethylbenzimidazole pho